MRLFEPFQRLDDRGGPKGLGLGLAIARRFVESMGGELVLDDTPGGGVTATIRLQVAPMTRVLVVDDEPQIRKALRLNLVARGYEVELAASGEEALVAAGQSQARRRAARPRPARDRRRRGDRGDPRLVRRAHRRAVGTRRRTRQGRRPRRRRRRLRHQAVRHRGAARPAAGRRSVATGRRPRPRSS